MFEIVFFGTSASAPSIYRGLSSLAIIAGEDRFLVDCGEGTQRQILKSGIGFKRLNRIMITHSHLDHILGLGGLVSTFVRWESMDDLTIWAGNATMNRVQTLLHDVVFGNNTPRIPINYETVTGGEIYKGKNFTVSAFPVVHRGPDCYGYVFEEQAHRPFLAEKAEALGIPPGPERGRLVRGETITLADGREITPDMVLAEEEKGVKIVITGDIARLDLIEDVVRDADVLITEATFMHADRDIARRFGHITTTQAAEFARDLNVRHLLITHVSRRYREFELIREAKDTFSNTTVVRDLDHFAIRRGQSLERVEKGDPSEDDDITDDLLFEGE